MSPLPHVIAFVAALGVAEHSALGDVIHDTQPPGGPFGYWGPDVSAQQSVGARFAVTSEYALSRVGIYFMNNDFSGATHPVVTITLRPDATNSAGQSVPGTTVLESWSYPISAVGWDPVQEFVESPTGRRLHGGRNYWIVAESQAPGGLDAVWLFSANGLGYSAFRQQPDPWSGGSGAELTLRVEAESVQPCRADWDGSGRVEPADVAAFINAWLASLTGGTSVGDFDGNGAVEPADVASFVGAWVSALSTGC